MCSKLAYRPPFRDHVLTLIIPAISTAFTRMSVLDLTPETVLRSWSRTPFSSTPVPRCFLIFLYLLVLLFSTATTSVAPKRPLRPAISPRLPTTILWIHSTQSGLKSSPRQVPPSTSLKYCAYMCIAISCGRSLPIRPFVSNQSTPF